MPPKKQATEDSAAARFGRVRNNLKMGLVGLPNVGKSSLFNLLTAQSVAAENFPFCTIDPNEARCAVPDERYEWLCKVWQPPSEYPAYLQCTDIAGLIRGASEGAGLGNAFLSHIQAVDGIFHVIRAFESEEVVHVDDTVDPIRDLETIQGELCKKDLSYVLAQRKARETDVRKNPTMKLPPLFFTVMDTVQELLEANKSIASKNDWTAPEVDKINELIPAAITTKPIIYLVNLTKRDFIRKGNKWLVPIKQWVDSHGGGVMIPFSVEFEQELWDQRKVNKEFVPEVPSVLPRIIKVGYKQLNLMYYFTAGDKEVRCWTLRKGATAPQAAGVIHSDFERGFIKAEVVGFEDFKTLSEGDKKGMSKVKAAGKYRQEGKTYVVQDGDIIYFQFNVTNKKK
ncbi:GTP-binding protein YchF [Aphanomyces astaci]|uniref:Obg-like ATPase homolog n=3 Tax=Aphanomyces astaci TaxID=112090 RepID=W4FHC1_APHAT|nr:GTP-binding protein YchF [Aphanomyces astaci]ETV66216.1 GTP-binding protein YchF [Aphanomyces astaci]|eukprot:XP_009844285.1 GTP-binding protein YchF [Aphanomyces astaci]